jgi:symplekin
MMKPPARQIALDAVEDIWRTCKYKIHQWKRESANHSIDDDAKPMAAKYLAKWRPGFLERNSDTNKIENSARIQLSSTQSAASVTT